MGNICCGSREESSKAGAFTTAGSSEIDGAGHADNKWEISGGGVDSSGGLSGPAGGSGSATAQSAIMDQQHQAMMEKENAAAAAAAGAAGGGSHADALLLREEQARLEMIVQAAGRGMVAVRSTRGSNAYYDQGFAAALGQHLEQTTKFPQHLPRKLPPYTSSTTDTAAASSGGNDRSIGSASSLGGANKTSTSTTASKSSDSSIYARLNQPAWEFIQLGTKKHGLAGCAGENPHAYFDHVAESFLDEIVPNKKRLFANVQPIVESLL